MKHGTGSGRGRHRKASSPETRKWLEVAPKVDGWKPEAQAEPKRRRRSKPKLGPEPAKPPWMDAGEYAALVELRKGLR